MKYLVIDTNIYIDMVVSRNGSHKAESYNQLMKLLDYGKVKLIVPKIVITEVFRHINNEIDKVGQSIDKMKSRATSLYWINHVEELERFNRNLKPIKSGINTLSEEFHSNKDNYKYEYKELFSKLFYNSNSIIIEETQDIIFKATQRKVYKRIPFHYEEKDINKNCMADSIIIESLINIEEFIKLNKNDKIYFISRNFLDFSDKNDKNLLHDDIVSDLKLKGLEDKVNYRLMFTKMLLEDFKDEIELVGLTEQLESEAEYELQEEIKESYDLQEDLERESAGLSSLSSSNYEDRLPDLDKIIELIDLLEEMKNDIQKKCEEFSEEYYSLKEVLDNKSIESLKEIIQGDSLIQVIIGEYEEEDGIKDELMFIFNWIVGDECYADFGEDFKNQDCFSLNTTLSTFRDSQNNEYRIETVGFLNATSGENDHIYIRLYKGNRLLEEGEIDVYYGYIKFDDDGNVDDGANESVNVSIDNILDSLLDTKNKIIGDLDNRILKSRQFIEILN